MKRAALAYKPLGWALGAVSGVAAGALFRQAWQFLADEDEAPDATDQDRGWWEILLAAAAQGAIFAVVEAAVERGGAHVVERLTGDWPD